MIFRMLGDLDYLYIKVKAEIKIFAPFFTIFLKFQNFDFFKNMVTLKCCSSFQVSHIKMIFGMLVDLDYLYIKVKAEIKIFLSLFFYEFLKIPKL